MKRITSISGKLFVAGALLAGTLLTAQPAAAQRGHHGGNRGGSSRSSGSHGSWHGGSHGSWHGGSHYRHRVGGWRGYYSPTIIYGNPYYYPYDYDYYDSDGDGVPDYADRFPYDPFAW
jgi:hypothetical protein